MKNQSGKVITVFLVIFSILLVSSTAISIFLFQKEREFRKAAESNLSISRSNEAQFQAQLKEAEKQVALLQEKNKEADEKINSLLDELELEKGLREELKTEAKSLREALQQHDQVKEQLRQELTRQLTQSQERIKTLETKLAEEMGRGKEFQDLSTQLQNKIQQMETQMTSAPTAAEPDQVNLETIVVRPEEGEGKVLTVDGENEFVIVDLGERDGIASGDIMSIFRDNQYLGDVKVNRVQSEMSAADFIPPLSAKQVSKNDRVTRKQ